MNKKTLIIIIIAVIAIISITSWLSGGETSLHKPANLGEPVKIGVNVWPGYAYVFIAQEKGFFEKNGVNVELVLEENYGEHLKHYENKEVDGIFEVFSDTISQNINNLPAIVVYAVDYSTEGDVIVGNVNSLSELKGKKVGVDGLNTFSHFFVLQDLELAGVDSSEVEFVNVPASDVLTALESGEINAGHTWEPTKSRALEKGYKQLGKARDIPNVIIDVLAFNPEFIKERPEDVQAIISSLIEARDFVFSNKEEAIKIMAEAENMSEVDMSLGIDGAYLMDLSDNRVAFSYAAGFESLHGVARRINEFMREQGITDRKLDSMEFINPTFVRNIK